MGIHRSTKTYGHDVGLSVCFRQWRAASHCRLLHGYAIAVRIVFEAEELDENGWVQDFGDLKDIKAYLQDQFDHTVMVAADDPKRAFLESLAVAGLANIRIVPRTGCEAFARQIFCYIEGWLRDLNTGGTADRVQVVSVEVSEHGANSAIFMRNEK